MLDPFLKSHRLGSGLKRSGVGLRIVVGIIFIRYIMLPLIGIGVVKAAHHLGLIGSDRLYQFVLMLQFAVPPAVAISMSTFSPLHLILAFGPHI